MFLLLFFLNNLLPVETYVIQKYHLPLRFVLIVIVYMFKKTLFLTFPCEKSLAILRKGKKRILFESILPDLFFQKKKENEDGQLF